MKKYLKFNTPAHNEAKILASDYGLKNHGLVHLERVYWNLPESALYEEIVFRNEGRIAYQGPVIVNTGKHTARAAADKYVVKEDMTENKIWWGEYNRPFSLEKFNALLGRIYAYCQDEELFVQDCHAGASPEHQMPVRIITEKAWHSLFVRNMFITTGNQDLLRRHFSHDRHGAQGRWPPFHGAAVRGKSDAFEQRAGPESQIARHDLE